MPSRRAFLATSAFTAGAAACAFHAGPALARAASPATRGIEQRAIPSTGERIPVIGAGTSGSYETTPGSEKYRELTDTIRAFFDGGGTVFDTSPNYGGADAVLGQLLEETGLRSKCFLATKIAADSAEAAQAQWAKSLKDLRTDRVELLLVHNLRDWQRQLPYAQQLKAEGKTKYVGVTHYLASGLPELERILRTQKLDFIQINYSPNAREAAETVLPLARDKGVAVMINRAFDDGKLFAKVADKPLPGWAKEAGVGSWAQAFLRFALAAPGVTVVIPATSRVDRQRDQLAAGTGPVLTAAQQQDLIRAVG